MKRKRTKHNSVLPLVLSVGMCTSTMMATQAVSTSDAFATSTSNAVSQSLRGGADSSENLVQFKDKNFKQNMLMAVYGKTTDDSGRELTITKEQAHNFKLTDSSGKPMEHQRIKCSEVEDISGIEDFWNIDEFDFSFRSTFRDLTPLSYASRQGHIVKQLKLRENSIESLREFKGLEDAYVQELDLSGKSQSKDFNRINNIETLENAKYIESINLSHNEILDIRPLLMNTKISSCDLSHNKIREMPPSPFGIGTGEYLKYIKKLYLKDNDISSFSRLSRPKNLEELSISPYYQTTLPRLSDLTKLNHLEIYNRDPALGEKEFKKINKTVRKRLKYLDIYGSQIDDFTIMKDFASDAHVTIKDERHDEGGGKRLTFIRKRLLLRGSLI